MPIEAQKPCLGRNGMVAAMDPRATLTGIKVLQEGGNAVDAAVAIAAVMNVVEPQSSGIGGDAFILVYDAKTKRVTGINGSGVVPYAATVDYYQKQGMTHMPNKGIHSVSVPGAVDAYVTVLDLFGTMPLKELLQPAIRYAEEGVLMTAQDRRALIDYAKELPEPFQSTVDIFCKDGFLSDRVGILINRDLGKSLRLIAEEGRDAFYKGEIAQAIVACSEVHGGLFTMKEFEDHQSMVYEPISTTYRGYTVYETTLPSQGHIVLEELNIVEGFDLKAMGYGSVDCIHHMVEAKKLAFADRLAYSGDPDFVDVPLEELISKEFATMRRKEIDPNRAATEVTPGNTPGKGGTTSFVVADGEGNAVSFIISLSSPLGSGLVADGTGIVLNNRPGYAQGFVFDEGHPNRLEPGKRTMHTLNTYLVCHGDELFFLGNTPGGDLQPQLNFQAIVNVIDFEMEPQQVAEAPNWSSRPGTTPADTGKSFILHVEGRLGEETIRGLEQRGHVVIRRVRNGGVHGRIQMIIKDLNSGVLLGGSRQSALGF